MPQLKPIEWLGDRVRIIDQTRLPAGLVYEEIRTVEAMYEAIRSLKVRGAPLIGVSAAYGMCIAARSVPAAAPVSDCLVILEKNADYLAQSRPTAVNLFWALERIMRAARGADVTAVTVVETVVREAVRIEEEDRAMCRAIGEHGFGLLRNCSTLLTHCNAGGLATSGYGTALAPVYVGKEKGKVFSVFADETRPLLQGARITAFELQAEAIPVTLICDNMAAAVMAQGKVDAVIVGADRIASNGDTANKIGTYGLALAARAHKVPFYVAAPASTFDLSLKSGAEIPIELRDDAEITGFFGRVTAPEGVRVYNPAFDVTPGDLISAIITDRGVLLPPYEESARRTAAL